MSAETIVNTLKFAWPIIKEGKASAEIADSKANAVPQVDDWQSLTDVRGPSAYRMSYDIGFVWPLDDYDHVQMEIGLKWNIGARYRGGGAFIPAVWIVVPKLYVGYGWDVNISFTAQNPENAGDERAPIARIPVTVKGTVSGGLDLYHVEWGFVLFGDGRSTTT
jgi:hypothetical protein